LFLEKLPFSLKNNHVPKEKEFKFLKEQLKLFFPMKNHVLGEKELKLPQRTIMCQKSKGLSCPRE